MHSAQQRGCRLVVVVELGQMLHLLPAATRGDLLVPRDALLDEPLIQVGLLGHSVRGHGLDVLGRPLVAQHFLDLADHLLLVIEANSGVSSQADAAVRVTYIKVFDLLVLLPLVELFDPLPLLDDELLQRVKVAVVLLCDLLQRGVIQFAALGEAA